jgi:hypothetical protein
MVTSNAVVSEGEVLDEPVVDEPLYRDTAKVSWASIIAGLVVALGAWVLLTILGLAVGLSSVDPSHPASLRTGGMVSGIWSLVVAFIALLIGGLVSARTAGIVSRPTGAIHGLVLWALATIASLWLAGVVVKGVVTTAAGLGSEVVGAAGSVVSNATGKNGTLETLGIRPDDLLGPVNDKLRAEGKPQVTAAQLDATLKDAASTGVREGKIDRDVLVTSLARNTKMTRADAEDVASRIDTTVSSRSDQARRDLETTAAKTADTTGKAMWWAFLGMIIGLGSAVIGSTLGVSRRQRVLATPPHRRHGHGAILTRPAHA